MIFSTTRQAAAGGGENRSAGGRRVVGEVWTAAEYEKDLSVGFVGPTTTNVRTVLQYHRIQYEIAISDDTLIHRALFAAFRPTACWLFGNIGYDKFVAKVTGLPWGDDGAC